MADDKSALEGTRSLTDIQEDLRWIRSFIEYARYELQPGAQMTGDQLQCEADKAIAKIDAILALSRLPADQEEERGWLIEKYRDRNGDPIQPEWWDGSSFRTNADHAMRFSREIDGKLMLSLLLGNTFAFDCRVTEHLWEPAPSLSSRLPVEEQKESRG